MKPLVAVFCCLLLLLPIQAATAELAGCGLDAELDVASQSELQASFFCDHNGGDRFNIDWFIGKVGEPPARVAADLESMWFNYTFPDDGSYRVTCGVWSDELVQYAAAAVTVNISVAEVPPPPALQPSLQSLTPRCTDKNVNQPCTLLSDTTTGCRTLSYAEPGNNATEAIRAQVCMKANNVIEVYRQSYDTTHNLEACFSGICVDKYWGYRSGSLLGIN